MTHDSSTTDSSTAGLNQGLKQRHMTLIAIGGTIGAGLFVGSGVVIHAAGPGALISFLIAGVLITLVMRMLGEMAVAEPAIGSFYEYARVGLGNWAGFSIGWLYWYFWVVVVAVEAVAGAAVLGKWLPGAPVWLTSLVLLVLMTATNMISVRAFGEFEYWFSTIKVVAIVIFIILGTLFVIGLWPQTSASVANLTQFGGFVPNGWGQVISSAVPAVAFFVGVELVTVAAAESAEPGRAVARATNSVVIRVLLFYVGSIFLVVTIVPWNSQSVLGSPYVAVLDRLSIPGAADIMNAIILTAVLSALNSGLYATSRMLFALTRRGHAPKALVKVNSRGVPVRAILLGTVVALISIGMAYVSPTKVFEFLISSYGATALFVYLLIAIAQVRMRRRLQREGQLITFKMWLFPLAVLFHHRRDGRRHRRHGGVERHPDPGPVEPADLRDHPGVLRHHGLVAETSRTTARTRGGRGPRRGRRTGGGGSPMKRRRIGALYAAYMLALGLLLAGCGNAASGGKPAELRIAYQQIPNGALVVKHNRWLESELGIPVRWVRYPSGASVNQAVAGHQVDLGLAGSTSVAAGVPNGLSYRVAWIYDVIGSAEALVVRQSAGVTSLAGLAGKRVGVPFGSTAHFALLEALDRAGLDPQRVDVLDLEPADIVGAWQAGKIDAAYVWQPSLNKILSAGGTVLTDSKRLAEQGVLTADLGVVSEELATGFPTVVQTWVEQENRAVRQIQDDPQQAATAIGAELGLDATETQAEMQGYQYLTASQQLTEPYLGPPGRPGNLVDQLTKAAIFQHDYPQTQKSLKEKVYWNKPTTDDFAKAVDSSFLTHVTG